MSATGAGCWLAAPRMPACSGDTVFAAARLGRLPNGQVVSATRAAVSPGRAREGGVDTSIGRCEARRAARGHRGHPQWGVPTGSSRVRPLSVGWAAPRPPDLPVAFGGVIVGTPHCGCPHPRRAACRLRDAAPPGDTVVTAAARRGCTRRGVEDRCGAVLANSSRLTSSRESVRSPAFPCRPTRLRRRRLRRCLPGDPAPGTRRTRRPDPRATRRRVATTRAQSRSP